MKDLKPLHKKAPDLGADPGLEAKRHRPTVTARGVIDNLYLS